MGTVQHHQARSDALLRHARNATEAAIATPATPGPHPPGYIDPFIDGLADAADSIRRAAAHAATALAVHIGLRHNTTRRLQIALTDAIFCDHLRRGHLRTFRHTYTLAAVLNLPTPPTKSPASPAPPPTPATPAMPPTPATLSAAAPIAAPLTLPPASASP